MAEIYQRHTGELIEEKIFGERALRFTCQTRFGQFLTHSILKRKWVSRLVAHRYKTGRSAKQIPAFLVKYGIDPSSLSKRPEEYTSFNEFFIRKMDRFIDDDPDVLIAPADSRLLAYRIREDSVFSVKGLLYTVSELLAEEGDGAVRFQNGLCLVFRLCPTDYHRFCFPDSGTWNAVTPVRGTYQTVNTFFASGRVHATNYREKTVLHTDHFGDVAFIEVGAMLIGKIVQTAACPGAFVKGQEKGYFEYGASTVIMLLEDGRAQIDPDILEQSAKGIETFVSYGEAIGRKIISNPPESC